MKITSLVKINDGLDSLRQCKHPIIRYTTGTPLVFAGIHWYSLVFTGQQDLGVILCLVLPLCRHQFNLK